MASGPLADASFPDIRGIESYEGKKIHSARWDHSYDMSGKRVAVIGTGRALCRSFPIGPVGGVGQGVSEDARLGPTEVNFRHPAWARSTFKRMRQPNRPYEVRGSGRMRSWPWAWFGIPLPHLSSKRPRRRICVGR